MSFNFFRKLVSIALILVVFSSLALAQTSEEERKSLEAELSRIEKQIDEYETTVDNYRIQGRTLQSEVGRLDSNIRKLNLQIQATNISLKKLDKEINLTEQKIDLTERKIDLHKDALGQSLRKINENDNETLMLALIKNPSLSKIFNNLNDLLTVQDNIRITVQKIESLRDDFLEQNQELSLERSDVSALKSYQITQQSSLKGTKSEKNNLLAVTKGQEVKYQVLLKETQKSAAQIRSRIFQLLGGGELTFDEAYKLAKMAEGATGVRAAMLLAVLDRESALGQNVGRCNYKTAMNPKRDTSIFLELLAELKIHPDSIMVSCANSDGAYGGAMGPAQFIPSTWILYKDKIADITGNNPPSPWRNSDAFVATAIYVRDLLDICGQYSGLAKERCAAARYYAGRRWANYLWSYGDRVVTKAEQFQRDIDILSG